MSNIINQDKLLIVEGKDDKNLFQELCNHVGVTNYQVIPTNGIANYSQKIAAIASTPGFSKVNSVGIVRDADQNYNSTFQSVQAALRNSGLPVPRAPLTPEIDQNTGLSVNVFIMPDNMNPGMIEDLLLLSVQQNPAMFCVNQYFLCLNGIGINPRQMSKARVQTYLAAQNQCGISLGVAASRGYWPFNHNTLTDVRNFLHSL